MQRSKERSNSEKHVVIPAVTILSTSADLNPAVSTELRVVDDKEKVFLEKVSIIDEVKRVCDRPSDLPTSPLTRTYSVPSDPQSISIGIAQRRNSVQLSSGSPTRRRAWSINAGKVLTGKSLLKGTVTSIMHIDNFTKRRVSMSGGAAVNVVSHGSTHENEANSVGTSTKKPEVEHDNDQTLWEHKSDNAR